MTCSCSSLLLSRTATSQSSCNSQYHHPLHNYQHWNSLIITVAEAKPFGWMLYKVKTTKPETKKDGLKVKSGFERKNKTPYIEGHCKFFNPLQYFVLHTNIISALPRFIFGQLLQTGSLLQEGNSFIGT